jgi:hypothetical protein
MDEIELQADLLDMLEALARAEAEFVLIGGWALAVHGYGRGTDDILTTISGVSFDEVWADKVIASPRPLRIRARPAPRIPPNSCDSSTTPSSNPAASKSSAVNSRYPTRQ